MILADREAKLSTWCIPGETDPLGSPRYRSALMEILMLRDAISGCDAEGTAPAEQVPERPLEVQ